ncbi:tweedleW [Haematobia irritans]|uniref:tweedleW n=1 Tax=Haematobia irritans TaxID=7368 RepID=UPI003F4F807A
MKIFVTILMASCLALAYGAPQNYFGPNSLIPSSFLKPNQGYLPIQQANNFQQFPQTQRYIVPQQQQQQPIIMRFPMPADFPTNFNYQPAVTTGRTGRRFRPRQRIVKKPIVTKNFFIHSAPEETQAEIDEELSQLQQQPRKHYNVLFVKTPSQTNKAAALNLAKALKEEKTVVYVLAKKTSAADLQDAIQEAPQHINKPEVFFIKYRTPEEAANAQHQIQSQYDSLGGSTTITDEGVAPSTSVIGSLDASDEDEEEEQQQQQQLAKQEQQSGDYLPPPQQSTQQQYDEQQLVNAIQSATNSGYLPPSNQF